MDSYDSYIEEIDDLYDIWKDTFTCGDDPKGEIEIWPDGLTVDLKKIKSKLNYLIKPIDEGDRFDPVVNAKRIIQINVAIDKLKKIDKKMEGRIYDFSQWKQMNIQNLIEEYGNDLDDDLINDEYNNYLSDEESKMLIELLTIIEELRIV